MPKQVPLTGKKTVPSETVKTIPRKKEVITKSDVGEIPPVLIESKKEQELVKSANSIQLPGFLQTTEMPETSDRQNSGYVGFGFHGSKNWPAMQAAGVEEGQPYLRHEGQFIPCPNKRLEFWLLTGASYASLMWGKEGKIIFVSDNVNEKSVECNSTSNGGMSRYNLTPYVPDGGVAKLEPHYVMLLLVNLNGNLIPIKGDFRGTKSGGLEQSIRAIEAAATPEWAKLSDAHKITMAFPQPFGRVYNILRTKPGVGKASGNDFHSTVVQSLPATASQLQLLIDHFQNEEWKGKLSEAKINYDARVKFMEDILENGFDRKTAQTVLNQSKPQQTKQPDNPF